MKKIDYIPIAKDVISLEITALQKLKKKLDKSFNLAVEKIANCQSKIILSGVGKSGLIASKIASTMSSIGAPSFYLSASDSSHGDLGSISRRDILILISYSGKSEELKNIIQYANRHKIFLISMVSKKDSLLFKASDLKLIIPQVKESGEIIPTSSTASQLALGDALAIAVMKKKKFTKYDFKKIHPAGSLGAKLRTVEDLMFTGKKIPVVDENLEITKALQILSRKGLGVILVQNKNKNIKGIITDGEIRRHNEKRIKLSGEPVKKYMTKKPIGIDKNALAVKALSLMNKKKITSLYVFNKKNRLKIIGIIHIHNILNSAVK